jgi:hypothetical protein
MSGDTLLAGPVADDGYESYYTEKLWALIPEYYRTLDGDPPAPGTLRALVEIVGEKAAVLRRDIDRLWDDQAIELCDDWAVAYLGQLVAAVPLSAANPRGRRLAVARTIAYNRRKGTLAVAASAIRDIAGLEGVPVEAFRRLVRFPHRLDADAIPEGPVTATPRGGLLRVRNPRVAGLTDGPFDEAAHFPDIRRLRGPYGRFGIRKLNLHLSPCQSVPLSQVTPQPIAPGARLTLDPSGRDVPLFQRGQASERPAGHVREVDLPDPILCRRLNATRHRLDAVALAVIDDPQLDSDLAPLLGLEFTSAAAFRRVVSGHLSPAQVTTFLAALLDATLTEDAPKRVLWPDSLALVEAPESNDPPLAPSAVLGAELSTWGSGLAPEAQVVALIDPATGRVLDGPARGADPLFSSLLHVGLPAPIGAGGFARPLLPRAGEVEADAGPTGPGGGFTDPGPATPTLPDPLDGAIRFATSRTYEPVLPADRRFTGILDARLAASDGARPYLRFRPPANDGNGDEDVRLVAASDEARLEIDGLWIGLLAQGAAAGPLADPAPPRSARLVLEGNFDTVTLRHVTLDPGGEQARPAPGQGLAIPAVQLEILGQVRCLRIERSVLGPIREESDTGDPCNAGVIQIEDSIVQSREPGEPAIRTRLAGVELARVTVLGGVAVARLSATDSLITGLVRVTDNQNGCLRYSSTSDGADDPLGPAVLPPRFESHVVPGRFPPAWIASGRFGDADYGTLSAVAPEAVRSGAENGAEMGAFNDRALGVRLDDLMRQLRSLLPVGQTPQIILEDANKGIES